MPFTQQGDNRQPDSFRLANDDPAYISAQSPADVLYDCHIHMFVALVLLPHALILHPNYCALVEKFRPERANPAPFFGQGSRSKQEACLGTECGASS